MSKKHILVISQYFYPESFRVNLLSEELIKRGYEVTVLTGYPQYPYGEIYPGYGFQIPYEKKWNGINIERIKVVPRGHNLLGMLANCFSFVLEGYKWVKACEKKYDLIYVFEVSPVTVGLPAVKYKKKFGTPILFNVQDLWPENVEEVLGIRNKIVIHVINRIVDKIYKNSDKILCSSESFVKNITNRGVDSEKVVFWPQFCESPKNLERPACYENYFNVVFTGNLGYAQGLELLIESADLLRDKPIRWFIVGDGRAKDTLIKLVKEKELEKIIFFTGRLSEHEANSYVKFADCAYLSFSDNKLFDMTIPAKLQTYLSCGTPILGAVGGESAQIIEAAKCGYVSKKQLEDIVVKIEKMMSLSDVEIREMRQNALLYFEENFQMDKILNELEKIMESVSLTEDK